MKKNPDRIETEAEINARAWKDPEFKRKLLADPKAALKDLGMENLPPSLKIRVVEEEKELWYLVLHTPPPNVNELSPEDLMKVSGGSRARCFYVM